MKKVTRYALASLLALCTTTAFAGAPIQLWHCELDDDATEEAVMAGVERWLASARQVDGGANLKVQVLFPVAVNAIGDFDMWKILSTTSFEEWGRFWDNYPDSPASDVEEKTHEFLVCPDSALWEVTKVE